MAIDLQLAGKTAIVTGGSAGIGLLLRNTFWNPYPAGLSGNLENVFLSYVASGDRR